MVERDAAKTMEVDARDSNAIGSGCAQARSWSWSIMFELGVR